MKITKQQLKQIIKEELDNALYEQALTPAEQAEWVSGHPTSVAGGTQRVSDVGAGVPKTAGTERSIPLAGAAAQVINGFDALRLKVQERGAELEENL